MSPTWRRSATRCRRPTSSPNSRRTGPTGFWNGSTPPARNERGAASPDGRAAEAARTPRPARGGGGFGRALRRALHGLPAADPLSLRPERAARLDAGILPDRLPVDDVLELRRAAAARPAHRLHPDLRRGGRRRP